MSGLDEPEKQRKLARMSMFSCLPLFFFFLTTVVADTAGVESLCRVFGGLMDCQPVSGDLVTGGAGVGKQPVSIVA